MECLVKVFDHEQLNNLLIILAFKPRKVIFLFDNRDVGIEDVKRVESACKLKLKDTVFQYICVNIDSIHKMEKACKRIIHDNPDCYFDITGGGEISAIAIYNACIKTFTPLFKLDIKYKKIINIYGCKHLEPLFHIPNISMDSLFMLYGAYADGNTHPTPPPELFDSIIKFCDAVFKDLAQWKELCFYLQIATSSYEVEYAPLLVSAPKEVSYSKGTAELRDMALLNLANELSLITGLKDSEKRIKFSFKNNLIKKYMTDYGTWLELYVYILVKQCKDFKDVRLSVIVNWDNVKNDSVEVVNEIDLTFFYGVYPVFISCKLSEPTSESLQELSIYRSYFGGRRSKCILVSLANIKRDGSHIRRRAKDMKIDIIDGKDIKQGNLISRLKDILNNKG